MTFPRRARDLLLVAGLLVLALLVLRASTRSQTGDLNAIDRAILRVSAPIQSGATSLGESVKNAWSRYMYLVDVKRDNERLKDENARLKAELSRVRVDLAKGNRLEQLLQLRRELPSETLAARVVGVDTSSYFRVVRVRLDRGENEVRLGMPVLAAEGVVGRVNRVFGRFCDVTLAVDPKSSIDVLLPRTGSRGMLRGAAGENGYRAKVDYLARGDEIKEGDEVVTSGIGAFPRGLPVGKVARVVRRDSGLWQEVEVVPIVDFTRLDEVLVVLAPPPPPDPDAAGPGGAPAKKSSEPHRGLGVVK